MIRLSRKPVMPRNPPILFFTMFQTFSANVGRYRSRFGIIFSALTSSCCRSAELILAGAAEIVSTGDGVVSGSGVAVAAAGFGDGACGGGVPSKKFTRLDDADFPRLVVPPATRLYWTIRSTMRSRAFCV